MTYDKWRTRYDNQKEANNLLSERLREERKKARVREGRMLQHIRQLQEDNKTMLSDTIILKSALQENGIDDPTIVREDSVPDEESSSVGTIEVLEEEKD